MIKRKILLGLLGVFAIFGFTACETENDTPPQDQDQVETMVYDVTFEVNGHGVKPASIKEITKLPSLPVLTEDGWNFEGWFYDAECTKKATAGEVITEDTKLYAKWTEDETIENPVTTKPISGISFVALSVPYDGNEHSVLISGALPSGVNVEYTNNKGTNAGIYNAVAVLKGEGYTTLTLNTTLTITKAQFTGLSLKDATYTYDGQMHAIVLNGNLPLGSNVSYSCSESSMIKNSAANVGQYHITAIVSNPNYETATFQAVLTIVKKSISDEDIQFEDSTFDYDGFVHTIEIVGVLPEGVTVEYHCLEDSSIENQAIETGTYTIVATISGQNYETKQLTAKLTIKASDDERFMIYYNNTLYFANALDHDYFYAYTASGDITKVSSDIPYNFTVLNGDLYYRSYSRLASSIKVYENSSTKLVVFEKGEYLCTDGQYLYYAVNGLTENSSGIYKLDTQANEPEPILVSKGKAKYLQIVNNFIYFADGSNGWKLSKISISGGTRTIVVDEKITTLIVQNDYLFFTVDNLLGNYIANYDITTGTIRKLTSDAGSNLTIVGNDLYYINVDLLTSTLLGKGIYKVEAYPNFNNNLPGRKFIAEENESYSSLTLIGADNLGYYKVSTQMLCSYNINSGVEIEILKDFVAPEVQPLSTGSKVVAYGNVLYYLDLYNDKALYSYNTITKARIRITSNKVSDFSILGDMLYFNSVSFGVNNSLYKINLKTGGIPERISTNDCNDIVTDGNNLYYVEKNAVGSSTAIHKIGADGTDVIIYTKGVDYLTYYNNYLYFVDDKSLYKISILDETYEAEVVKNGNIDTFVIYNNIIYFREMHGILGTSKNLSQMNIDGTNEVVLVDKNTDPLHIVIDGQYLYYYTDTILGTSGIYRLKLNSTEEPELILDRQLTYYASDFTIINGMLYFVNYYNNLGDSHLYGVDLTTKELNKLD